MEHLKVPIDTKTKQNLQDIDRVIDGVIPQTMDKIIVSTDDGHLPQNMVTDGDWHFGPHVDLNKVLKVRGGYGTLESTD